MLFELIKFEFKKILDEVKTKKLEDFNSIAESVSLNKRDLLASFLEQIFK